MNLGAHLRNPESDQMHAANVIFYAGVHDYLTALHCAGLLSDTDRATRARGYVIGQLKKEWATMQDRANAEEQTTVEAALRIEDNPAIGKIQDTLRQIRERHTRIDEALAGKKKRNSKGKAA